MYSSFISTDHVSERGAVREAGPWAVAATTRGSCTPLLRSLHAKVVRIKATCNNVDPYRLFDSCSQGAAGRTFRWTINYARLLTAVTRSKPSWCRLQRRKKHRTTLILSLNESCTTMDVPIDLPSESSISMMFTIPSKAKVNTFHTPQTS